MHYTPQKKHFFTLLSACVTLLSPYLHAVQDKQPTTLTTKVYTTTALLATTLFNNISQPPQHLIANLEQPNTITNPKPTQIKDYLQQVNADLDTINNKTKDQKEKQAIISQKNLPPPLRNTIDTLLYQDQKATQCD